jgi:hypothetical protein
VFNLGYWHILLEPSGSGILPDPTALVRPRLSALHMNDMIGLATYIDEETSSSLLSYMVAESHKWYFGAIHFSLVSRILRLYYMCTGINTVSVLYIEPWSSRGFLSCTDILTGFPILWHSHISHSTCLRANDESSLPKLDRLFVKRAEDLQSLDRTETRPSHREMLLTVQRNRFGMLGIQKNCLIYQRAILIVAIRW